VANTAGDFEGVGFELLPCTATVSESSSCKMGGYQFSGDFDASRQSLEHGSQFLAVGLTRC
jgi:hypothetical protein